MIKKIILFFLSTALFSQNINLNNEFINSKLRYDILNNKAKTNHTLNIFPIEYETLKRMDLNLIYMKMRYFQIKKTT